MMPLSWLWPLHSGWTRERTCHYLIPLAVSTAAYGVWTWSSGHPHQHTIKLLVSYGMSFLALLAAISQPSLIAYRTSTLYGAAEQATGTAATFVALSIASIIAPQVLGPSESTKRLDQGVNADISFQMFPNSDAPLYHKAFVGTCAIIAVATLSYLTLPFLLSREARARKRKTGHAMSLRAMEDAGKLKLLQTLTTSQSKY